MGVNRNIFKGLLLFALLAVLLGSGCAMFKKPLLVPRESGDTLVEITDSKQLPNFQDDYSKDTLLRSIDNSLDYFKKVKSNPYDFHMKDFSHENLVNTLRFFREGFSSYRNAQELNEFIIKNFRVF
ncbi:MAG: hypothetical protein KGQ83_08790, partial [Planctomycetes bacterium]|nr:hypothetical protein [Planctomycetota bacterium]